MENKGDLVTTYIDDLKPGTCVEIVNNLHGKEKFDKKISVYALVDPSPIKESGKVLENLIKDTEENLETKDRDVENLTNSDTDEKCDDEECSKQTPENISKGYKVENKKSPSSSSGLIGNLVRYWNGNDDLHISEDSDEDVDKAVDDIITKRKYFEKSPENEFQKTGKQKRNERRSKKARNKSN